MQAVNQFSQILCVSGNEQFLKINDKSKDGLGIEGMLVLCVLGSLLGNG